MKLSEELSSRLRNHPESFSPKPSISSSPASNIPLHVNPVVPCKLSLGIRCFVPKERRWLVKLDCSSGFVTKGSSSRFYHLFPNGGNSFTFLTLDFSRDSNSCFTNFVVSVYSFISFIYSFKECFLGT